jgi:lysophospholipase L1-like esterase
MSADASTQIDPFCAAGNSVLLAMEGTNDMYFGASATTAYQNLAAYYAARKAAGCIVVAYTILPRSEAGVPVDFETSRQALNALLRSNHPWADALVDIGGDTSIGQSGQETGVMYLDRVHPSTLGHSVIARLTVQALTQ